LKFEKLNLVILYAACWLQNLKSFEYMKTKLLLFFVPFLFSLEVMAQQNGEVQVVDAGSGSAKIFVRGRVLSSESGKPIPGVSVGIPDVATAITDDDGRFSLGEVMKGLVIQVSMSGFAYKEVVTGASGDLTIHLHDESFKTMYRQVEAPFGSKNFVEATYAITAISNRESYKKAALSPESLIQDEVAGVNTIIKSGAQGAGGNMYMRGFSSINAGTQPMILIDGVPYENAMVTPSLISGNNITPLTGIDVKDIENITVLKDATSLYGSKGANGVILIETAKSREQATKIDFHAYGGFSFTPTTQYAMMNAWEYRSYLTEMLMSSGISSEQVQSLPYINSEKPVVQPWGVEGNADFYRYRQETDWQKEIFQNGINQNYYLSIKGGDNIALYALSVGYLNHDGIIKNTDFSRYGTQFNSQINVLRMLKMSTNMSFSYGDRQLAYEGSASNFNPLYVSLVKAPFMSPFRYNEQGLQTPVYEQADVFGVSNPTALVDKSSSVENKTYRFFGNVGATLDLGKGFDLNATFGVTFDKSRENVFLAKNGLFHDPLPSSEVTNEIQGLVSRFLQYYLDAYVGYQREFEKVHSLTAHLGMRYQTNTTEGDWIKAYNSSSDDLQSLGNGNLDLASMSGALGGWKWMSFYFNGEYSYMKRYFIAYNMALDASSRFGKDADGIKLFGGNVFGAFPSVTAAWLVSSENFMRSLKMIDILKLRVGYSLSGNDDLGNYSARTTYTSQNLFGYYGLLRANIANSELKWEESAKLNAGLDISLLNERLSLSLDLYQTSITDLLTWKKGSEYYGIEQYAVNDGAMKNTGVDVGIGARVINAAFKWDIGLNLSRYLNEVTQLSGGERTTTIAGANVLTKTGAPIGQFYGYKTNDVYATSAEAADAGLNIQRGDGALIPFQAGDVRFVNLNDADNIINEKDMTVIGDPNPDLFGSIVNKLQWKRWTLNAVVTFSYGNDVYNALRANLEAMTGTENQTLAVNNRWSYEGHQTSMPKAVWGDPRGNARFSDRWIEDGSYVRLKTLSIAYDIPVRLNFIKGLQVYATGNNLLTFTKYLGYDPEFSAMQSPLYYGIDMGITPHPRAIMLGV
jgi:TonB-linked SusC/RagA family outer membrane protein